MDSLKNLNRPSLEYPMNQFKVEFDSMEWQSTREGMRFKRYSEGSRQLRLVEFFSSDVPSHWCEVGHVGFVLSGALEIEFSRKVVSYAEGDGIFIPSGSASAHRASSITPGTRLVMVEEP